MKKGFSNWLNSDTIKVFISACICLYLSYSACAYLFLSECTYLHLSVPIYVSPVCFCLNLQLSVCIYLPMYSSVFIVDQDTFVIDFWLDSYSSSVKLGLRLLWYFSQRCYKLFLFVIICYCSFTEKFIFCEQYSQYLPEFSTTRPFILRDPSAET
jgi:hypothetical protein